MALKQRKGTFFYANGKKYDFPFDDFPTVHSSLHPCFLLTTLVRCTNMGLLTGRKHLTPLGTNLGLVASAFFVLNRFFHVSWLGNTVAANFPNRRIPTVRTNQTASTVPDQEDTDYDYEVEPTPPPEALTPEALAEDDIVQPIPQSEPSTQSQSFVAERSPDIASTPPTEALEPGPDVCQRKRKIAQASPTTEGDSVTRPAKRRSPRFTPS